ncbi:MAG: tetratricopeptide repeat protein [Candidatus Kapaibacterium sp.]|nr:MAG: tetratricopeptide repeat protein [Candidatus Kapabacteria bacterium]
MRFKRLSIMLFFFSKLDSMLLPTYFLAHPPTAALLRNIVRNIMRNIMILTKICSVLCSTLCSVFWMFFFCLNVSVSAQTRHLDSLHKLLKTVLPDSVRVLTLNEIGFQLRKSNIRVAEARVYEALTLGERVQFVRGMAESMRILGVIARTEGKYDSAIKRYSAAMELSETIGDKRGEAAALNNLAIIYSNKGETARALDAYSRSLGIKESLADTLGISTTLNNIGQVYYEQGLYKEARQYFDRAILLARKKNDAENIALLLVNIAAVLREKGEFTQAMAYFREALSLRELQKDNVGIAAIMRSIGEIYRIQGSRALAMEMSLKGLKIARELNDKELIAKAIRSIGIIFEDERKFVEATEHYTQALGMFREIGYERGIYETLHALGSVYDEQAQFDIALDYYRQSLAMKRVANDRKGIAMSLNNMGYIFERRQQYEEAFSHYQQALTIHQDIGNTWGMAAAYTNLASIYRTTGNYAMSEKMGLRGMESGEKEQALGFLYECAGILADMYEKSGNYPKALEFQKRVAIYQDSLTNRAKAREVARLSVEYDVDRKQAENLLLKRDAEVQQATLHRQYTLLVAGGLGGVLLLVLALVLIRSNTSRKRANTRLTEMNSQLEQSYRNVENLNDIARAVASTLDLQQILSTVYARVNGIMDATIFGLGLVERQKHVIAYRLVINNGQRLEPYERSLDDKNQFAVWCVEQEKEVFINDIEQEYHHYISSFREKILVQGEKEIPQSLLYVPLIIHGEVVGVLSVQTPKKNAYTRYHVEMLRAIASYAASALNNAQTFGEIQRQQLLLSEQASEIELANTALHEAHEESETLLRNILPNPIVHRLKSGERAIADHYDSVTVLFADIVGFTKLSQEVTPKALVEGLNGIFEQFDALAQKYGLEKIKTIGDAYMVAGGLPERSDDHCERVVRMAVEMQEVLANAQWNQGGNQGGNQGRMQFGAEQGSRKIQVRIGIHTGAAVAGVIGTSKFAYDIWGDTVNTASRMESHGEAGRIHVSEDVFMEVQDTFAFEERGEMEIKGKGRMRTWLLAPISSTTAFS